MKTSALDYVCIFTGGSIRGGAYVGALRAMEELGVNNKCFVGSSIGAVMGAFYVVGYNPDELEIIFNDMNFDLFKDINFAFSKEFSISKGEHFLEWLREKIEQKFYGNDYVKGENKPVTFRDLPTDMVVVTTDLYNTGVKTFSRQETPDVEVATAVRISASMPGLMKPMTHDNHVLVDGDLSRSWPVWKVVPRLFDYNSRILEFRLEGSRERCEIGSTADYLNVVYNAFSNFAADNVMNIYQRRDKFDYIRLDSGDVNITDFNLSLEGKAKLYKMGYDTTRNYFRNILPQKRAGILPHYKKFLSELNGIKTKIEDSKYVLAKNKLAELFVYISKARRVIDTMYYERILDFYDEFMTKSFQVFGMVTVIKDKKALLEELDSIIISLDNKVNEIESFILSDLKGH